MVPGWWRPLAIASGVAGVLAFLVLRDGRSQLAFNQGAIGAIVSVMLLITGDRLSAHLRLSEARYATA